MGAELLRHLLRGSVALRTCRRALALRYASVARALNQVVGEPADTCHDIPESVRLSVLRTLVNG